MAMPEFIFAEDTRKNLSEILEAIQKQQIAQARVLSQIQKQLKAISTDSYGAFYQCGQIASILGDMSTDLSVICTNIFNDVEKEDA